MGKLSALPNIGAVIQNQLYAVGIFTPQELKKIGAKEAFYRIKMIDSSACLHKLYALQGAIEGVRYTQLSESTKSDLKKFLNTY